MKTNLFAMLSSTIVAFATFNNASAQDLMSNDVAKLNVNARSSAAGSETATALSTKAGSKAFKNFSKQFKGAPEAEWFMSNDGGFVANFASEGGPTRVYYNQSGKFEYSLTRYNAANIPAKISNSVKNAFDGYRVICGEEIYVEGKTIYLVHIQSFTSSKTVRIADDEMEIIEELFHS